MEITAIRTTLKILVISLALLHLNPQGLLLRYTPSNTTFVAAAPLEQAPNPHSECPPNSETIWVDVNTNKFEGEDNQVLQIPFDTGSLDHNGHTYVNYLLGVLIGEVGPAVDFNPVDNELLKAMAILARTVAYKNCGITVGLPPDDHLGIDDSIKQQYDPTKQGEFSQAELDRYQQAIDATDGIYLTYNSFIFDVQYRDISRNPTNGTTPPHLGVYDPTGDYHESEASQTGIPQINANHWATGQNHNEVLPQWDYCRILSHYYTGVEFECRNTASPTPPDYRFDLLYLNEWDNREANPVPWQINSQPLVNFVLQNTGNNTWTLSDCNKPYGQRSIAIAGHWYKYSQAQAYGPVADFEGGRVVLCAGGINGGQTEPGETYPSQAAGETSASGLFYVPGADKLNVGQLYWLRWDVEFTRPHAITWGSRLQLDPDNQRWPTQDLLVRITSGTSNPPEDPDVDLDPPHQVDAWSNDDEINISWQPGGGNADHYAYAWEQDGQVESWQTTSATNLNAARSEGTHAFHLQAVAADGQASDVVSLNPILIDLTSPTAAVAPLPAVITDPTATSFTLSWSGSDEGGSGLYFDVAYTVQPAGAEPPPTPIEPHIAMTTATWLSLNDLGLTLQEGTTYTFWLRGHDGAGNINDWQVTKTVYRPVPMFHLEPAQISRLRIYTDTAPLVETATIANIGGGELDWTATVPHTQTALSQSGGIATSTLLITITYPLTFGVYSYPITFTGPISAYNNPQVLPITIHVVEEIFNVYLPLIFK